MSRPGQASPGGGQPVRRRQVGAQAGALPAPGRPVRGSRSGRPIMALLDVLGRRWALRVIWELRAGPLSFRALQERCEGMSSSVLNQRLRELRALEVLELGAGGYGLSEEGLRLLEAYLPLEEWATRWAARAGAVGELSPPAAASRARR